MGNQESLLKKTVSAIGGVFVSLLLGIVGGSLCGAAILVFGGLIGRSGSTGEEYWGYWDIATIWLGLTYGGIFGALVGPLSYPFLVRQIGFQRAILPACVGTLLGGFAGAILMPPVAVLTGIGGFFGALIWTRIRLSKITPAAAQ
jgi:hypothetical protein